MAKKKGQGKPSPQVHSQSHAPSWPRSHVPSQPQSATIGVKMKGFLRELPRSSHSQPHSDSRPSTQSVAMEDLLRQQSGSTRSHAYTHVGSSTQSATMAPTMQDYLRDLPRSSHSQSHIPEDSSKSDDESSSEESLSIGDDNDHNLQGGRQKKTRGPTRCLEVHRSSTDLNKIDITLNSYGQPNGPCKANVNKLGSYLGTLARNSHLVPLTYLTWHMVPNKDEIWDIVKGKFDIEEHGKKWVLHTICQDWRGYKNRLKRDYFSKFKTNAIRMANCPPEVHIQTWRVLVEYWSTPSIKALSRKNKINRSFLKNMHRTGSKPFSLIREEEKAKSAEKKEPTLAEMFFLTRKNAQMDEETMKKLAEYESLSSQVDENSESSTAKDEIFSRVMGEHPGRARLYGTGVTRSDIQTSVTMSARVASEARRLADIEMMEYKRETDARFKETNDKFNAIVSWVKAKFPGEDIPMAPGE